jgi:hypothetical protein
MSAARQGATIASERETRMKREIRVTGDGSRDAESVPAEVAVQASSPIPPLAGVPYHPPDPQRDLEEEIRAGRRGLLRENERLAVVSGPAPIASPPAPAPARPPRGTRGASDVRRPVHRKGLP